MQQSKDGLAQSFYLAQLEACKGGCECKVCQLLRQSVDLMTEQALSGPSRPVPGVEEMVQLLKGAGYEVTPREPGRGTD